LEAKQGSLRQTETALNQHRQNQVGVDLIRGTASGLRSL
jgi:hypothetical protein